MSGTGPKEGEKKDPFEKKDDLFTTTGEIKGGYDLGMARAYALEHAKKTVGESVGKGRDSRPLIWGIEKAGWYVDAVCWEVVLTAQPARAQVQQKGLWLYHVRPTGGLLPGTPLLRQELLYTLAPARRGGRLFLMLGVVVVLVIAGGGGTLFLAGRTGRPAPPPAIIPPPATSTPTPTPTATPTPTRPLTKVEYIFPAVFESGTVRGRQIVVPKGSTVTVTVSVLAAGSGQGRLGIEIRKDVPLAPDETFQYFEQLVNLRDGTNPFRVTFTPTTGTFYLKVYWEGRLIYDPQDSSARESLTVT